MLNTLLNIAKRGSLTWVGLGMAGTLAACASAPPTASGPMTLGAAATPPSGYLDFCARRPDQCGIGDARDASGQPMSTAELTRDLYARYYWAVANGDTAAPSSAPAAGPMLAQATSVGATASATIAAAPSAASDTVAASVAQATPVQLGSSDWRTPGDAVWTAPQPASNPFNADEPLVLQPAVYTGPGAAAWMRANPGEASPVPQAQAPAALASAGPAVLTVTPELMAQLDAVNRRVNGAIRYAHDWQAFGQRDYWALPLDPGGGGRGDCKDYVLEKRRALADQGVPAAAMSIAIVRIYTGELHAVLLVSTDHGELVLDSLSPWIEPWTKVHYRWIKRQAPGQQLSWVTIDSNSGSL